MLTSVDIIIILASMALVIGVGIFAGTQEGRRRPTAISSAATACRGG